MASHEGTIDLLLDDVTDPVFELAAWAEAIQRGEMAVVQLQGSPGWRLVAQPGPAQTHRMQVWEKGNADRPELDVSLHTHVLVEAFREFFDALERHPCLPSNWICFMSLSDDQYDHLSDEADRLWDQGVTESHWLGNWDVQRDFNARYVADRIQLGNEQTAAVENYRALLRAAVERLRKLPLL